MDNQHVSVWGRTLEEYEKMFGLKTFNRFCKIISIADGPSSFNLEIRAQGLEVLSVDPIYNLSIEELQQTFKKSYEFNKELFINNTQKFHFNNEIEIEQLLAKRQNTFKTFLKDYQENRFFYRYGLLPNLDFPTNSFDLCLCSNLLFIFDHVFDYDFHLKAINEMIRLSEEVRIFPLYNIGGNESEFLKNILNEILQNGYSFSIEENDYHVYKGGNRFLRIFKL